MMSKMKLKGIIKIVELKKKKKQLYTLIYLFKVMLGKD